MSKPPDVDSSRRSIVIGSCVVGVAAGVGAAVPFVASMMPSERAKALGAPVEADISKLQPGQLLTVEWRGKPVWVLRRTPEMVASIKRADAVVSDPAVTKDLQPAALKGNPKRSQKDEYFVAVGVCTHLGCSPSFKPDDDLFYCPCHGSKFDLAGRVYAGSPAPVALEVPPYVYLTDTTILIGADKKEG